MQESASMGEQSCPDLMLNLETIACRLASRAAMNDMSCKTDIARRDLGERNVCSCKGELICDANFCDACWKSTDRPERTDQWRVQAAYATTPPPGSSSDPLNPRIAQDAGPL